MRENGAKKMDQMVIKQAGRIRSDVNLIEAKMNALDFRLNQNFSNEEDITRRVHEIKKAHQSLNARIENAMEKMQIVKTLLASHHS